MTLKPRSLAGQMLLLVAMALIVAQGINLALLLSEARGRNANFFQGAVVARTVDAVERARIGQPPVERERGRGRVEITTFPNPAIVGEREPRVEARVRQALAEAAVPFSDVRAVGATGERGRKLLVISVGLDDGRWVTTRNRPPPPNSAILAPLIWQTLILLLALLVAAVLIGRRVAQPLNRLAQAAETFGTSAQQESVPLQGPSDVQRLIGTFNQMQTRILDMLDEKDRMLGAIGHDLRTPLASLRLRAESVDDGGEREKMIGTINEMNRTLDDILSFARLGRSAEEPVNVDISALVEALVLDLQDLGMAVQFTPVDRQPVVVRPLLLRRAIRNLVQNAVNYGQCAHLSVIAEGSETLILIDDEGTGIAEHDLERVMEGFVRLDQSRNRETGGSGLGLTIARSIIAEHGGSLRLENRSQGGLRAIIRLPGEAIA